MSKEINNSKKKSYYYDKEYDQEENKGDEKREEEKEKEEVEGEEDEERQEDEEGDNIHKGMQKMELKNEDLFTVSPFPKTVKYDQAWNNDDKSIIFVENNFHFFKGEIKKKNISNSSENDDKDEKVEKISKTDIMKY
jgi:hypothetical protein